MAEYLLELYIVPQSSSSEKALRHVKEVLRNLPNGAYRIKVFDVLKAVKQCEKMHIMTAPTLIRKKPLPERYIIGGFTDAGSLASAIGLDSDGAVCGKPGEKNRRGIKYVPYMPSPGRSGNRNKNMRDVLIEKRRRRSYR